MPPTNSTGERTQRNALAARLRELVTDASFATPDWTVESTWYGHAPFASWLVEALSPRVVVELGVFRGFSYFTLCQAAARHAPDARIFGVDTWEGDEHAGTLEPGVRDMVEAHNERYPRSTIVTASFDEAAGRFGNGEIDLLHLDGLHTYDAVRHDFETWLPRMSTRGVVVLHDTEVSERNFGVRRLMDDLEVTFPSFRFTHDYGLGVVGTGTELPMSVRTLLEANDDEALRVAVRDAYELLGSRIGHRRGVSDSLPEPRATRGVGYDLLRETLELRVRLRTSEDVRHVMESSRSWRITSPLRGATDVSRRWRSSLRRGILLHVPISLDRRRAFYAAQRASEWRGGRHAYSNWIDTYDALSAVDVDGMQRLAKSLPSMPSISVVMPVFDPELRHLEAAIGSVLAQAYENWQLCVADDYSRNPAVRSLLESYARRDPRVELVFRETNGGISAASNSALELAKGEVVSLLDHDDVLRPHALLLVAQRFAENPHLGLVYSDEDMINDAGVRKTHYFKPDWNRELLRSQNYLCHLASFRTELAQQVGGFRNEFDGAQDWDLALRLTERLDDEQIGHIPHVLYHWRTTSTSVTSPTDAKPYALPAGRAAVRDHLRRIGVSGAVVRAGIHQNVRYDPPADCPLVSVVVPTTMRDGLFDRFAAGLAATTYEPVELIRVARLGTIAASPPLPVTAHGRPSLDVELEHGAFNFARAVNLGCAAASGKLVLIVNDDIEVMHPDWLEIMVGHVSQPGVGAVGALLLYPDERVQHAGVLLGSPEKGGVAGHLYLGATLADPSYAGRRGLNQDLSCVTGACMLVRKEAFDEVGGFDERFAVAYNDVDFCLRLRERGWRIVFTPEAILTHLESASFGSHSKGRSAEYQEDVAEMQRRWRHRLRIDPAHNPNLALDSIEPWRLAFPPRVSYPWRSAPAAVEPDRPSVEPAPQESAKHA